MKNRYPELDALRGLAACVVVLRHCVNVLPDSPAKFILLRSPLRLVFAAHEAVLLFFLLSGFVLTLPYLCRSQSYSAYIIKRIFRIYVPYVTALALAVLGAGLLHGAITGLSPWFSVTWSQPVSMALVVEHVAFLGKYNVAQFNTAFWSLVYEMRISIFFPIVYLMATRLKGVYVAALGVLASALVCATKSSPYAAEYMMTLHYAAVFCLGSFLARHREWLCECIAGIRKAAYVGLCMTGMLLIAYGQGPPSLIRRFEPLTDWPSIVGCSFLLVVAISGGRISAILRHTVPQFLGRISYSLYLVHGTVLFALVHWLYGNMPVALILLLTIPLSIMAALLFHHAVESPAMEAGKALAARLEPPHRDIPLHPKCAVEHVGTNHAPEGI